MAFHLRQAVPRSSCSPQEEGAAQRFGETESSSCSWALGSSQRCSQGAAPHGCVPVFSFWEQGWQVVLVSHPRQPLRPAQRFHPVLKTPQLLPQQPLGNSGTQSFEDKVHPKKHPGNLLLRLNQLPSPHSLIVNLKFKQCLVRN